MPYRVQWSLDPVGNLWSDALNHDFATEEEAKQYLEFTLASEATLELSPEDQTKFRSLFRVQEVQQ